MDAKLKSGGERKWQQRRKPRASRSPRARKRRSSLPKAASQSEPRKNNSSRRRIDFSYFSVSKFTPSFFSSPMASMYGCGASALGLLTGVKPSRIVHRNDWDARFMVKFLRENGFEVAKLTQEKVTSPGKDVHYPLNSNHVLLASLRFIRKEASWVVLHNGTMYHNFELTPFGPYELLNHPLIELYLLKHPSWSC